MSDYQSKSNTDNVMSGASTGVENTTIEDRGITQSVMSRRLSYPFHLTESEIKTVTDLTTIVALLEKALAVGKEIDRELKEHETDIIINLKEQEEKLEDALVAVQQKEELKVLLRTRCPSPRAFAAYSFPSIVAFTSSIFISRAQIKIFFDSSTNCSFSSLN